MPQVNKVLADVLEAGNLALMGIGNENAADAHDGTKYKKTRSQVSAPDWGSGGFANEAMKNIRDQLDQKEMKPLIQTHHDGTGSKVIDRWENDAGFERLHFHEYRVARNHRLGKDLNSANPQETLLLDVLMPEVAKHSVLPLQNHLRELKDELIMKPVNRMARKIEERFVQGIKPNSSSDDDTSISAVINAVHETVQVSLSAWRDQEIGKLNMLFDVKLKGLETERKEILKEVMKQHLARVYKSFSSRTKRKEALASKSKVIAEAVVSRLLDYTQTEILLVLQQRMMNSFEQITRGTHKLIYAAVKRGDTEELVRSGAFCVSQYYARYTAGLVGGLMVTPCLVKEQLKAYHKINSIIELSQQPPLLATGDQNLAGILEKYETNDEMDVGSPRESGAIVVATSSQSNQTAGPAAWCCPNCGCNQDDLSAPLRIDNTPCPTSPGGCICEALPVGQHFCRLCVRYFHSKRYYHKMRPPAAERKRMWGQERKRKRADVDEASTDEGGRQSGKRHAVVTELD